MVICQIAVPTTMRVIDFTGGVLEKGRRINVTGTIVENKWIDGHGDEKKALRLRISSFLSPSQFHDIQSAFEASTS